MTSSAHIITATHIFFCPYAPLLSLYRPSSRHFLFSAIHRSRHPTSCPGALPRWQPCRHTVMTRAARLPLRAVISTPNRRRHNIQGYTIYHLIYSILSLQKEQPSNAAENRRVARAFSCGVGMIIIGALGLGRGDHSSSRHVFTDTSKGCLTLHHLMEKWYLTFLRTAL